MSAAVQNQFLRGGASPDAASDARAYFRARGRSGFRLPGRPHPIRALAARVLEPLGRLSFSLDGGRRFLDCRRANAPGFSQPILLPRAPGCRP